MNNLPPGLAVTPNTKKMNALESDLKQKLHIGSSGASVTINNNSINHRFAPVKVKELQEEESDSRGVKLLSPEVVLTFQLIGFHLRPPRVGFLQRQTHPEPLAQPGEQRGVPTHHPPGDASHSTSAGGGHHLPHGERPGVCPEDPSGFVKPPSPLLVYLVFLLQGYVMSLNRKLTTIK